MGRLEELDPVERAMVAPQHFVEQGARVFRIEEEYYLAATPEDAMAADLETTGEPPYGATPIPVDLDEIQEDFEGDDKTWRSVVRDALQFNSTELPRWIGSTYD